jgi:hypothetical protein
MARSHLPPAVTTTSEQRTAFAAVTASSRCLLSATARTTRRPEHDRRAMPSTVARGALVHITKPRNLLGAHPRKHRREVIELHSPAL